jgi:hypothetical protein
MVTQNDKIYKAQTILIRINGTSVTFRDEQKWLNIIILNQNSFLCQGSDTACINYLYKMKVLNPVAQHRSFSVSV